ncbi:hypothetical protein [Micromonospora sp. IBHARD004]|uniref:hypothetical protein n=1 Tax=Micromonospora sp. IBHARD004 TaxID=3457764 RepID=UPI0040597925
MSLAGRVDEDRNAEPLTPVYGFSEPGASIVLHSGPLGVVGTAARSGRVELSLGSRPGLRWHVEPDEGDQLGDLGAVRLRLHRRGRQWTVDAHQRSINEGWINHAEFAEPSVDLRRVLVHWMNLPNILGPIVLFAAGSGRRQWWAGRWQAQVDGWVLTLDGRPDHRDALKDAHLQHVHVLTHVMDIRRSDGSSFDVPAVRHLLESLRVGLSFAFGRWVAPLLPVGYDSRGRIVWEAWTSPICDPAQRIGSAWLYAGRPDDLTELVTRTVTAFNDDSRPGITRFQMQLAVQAVESGFVEQRIMAAFPALENLAWQALVLDGKMTPTAYKKEPAEDKLRRLLNGAHIPTDIDAAALPALAGFASTERLDGPTAVTRVRNRLIHPKSPTDQIYRHDGLVHDVWLLSRHYLTLLILHSIGYQGSYVKVVPPAGWSSDATAVPWAVNNLPKQAEGDHGPVCSR